MRSLKDTIEYLEDQLAELKLENDRLYKENCELKERLYHSAPLVYSGGAGDIGKYFIKDK